MKFKNPFAPTKPEASSEPEPSPAPPEDQHIALPVAEGDVPKARVLANRIIDLFKKEGIAPNATTMIALVMLVTEHSPQAKIEMPPGLAIGAPKGAAEGAVSMPKKDKDGNPIFMAPSPKMMQ